VSERFLRLAALIIIVLQLAIVGLLVHLVDRSPRYLSRAELLRLRGDTAAVRRALLMAPIIEIRGPVEVDVRHPIPVTLEENPLPVIIERY
jgi:hypothetical protein